MGKIRTAVVGATGYAGAELVRILAGHPDMELTVLTSRQYAGVKFSDVFPAMAGKVDLICEAYDEDVVCDRADAVFLGLPHKLPMAYVPGLIRRKKKIVDLSADFRFSHVAGYESAYQAHTAPELLADAVYGLPEVFGEQIRKASLVGNPGCYPTSVLLPLWPLIFNKLIDIRTLIADAKSGVSGAGRSLSLPMHFCEATESFRAYKVGSHRHQPEMDEKLSQAAKTPASITFVPHLVPMIRGMEATIYATLSEGVRSSDISECLAGFYADRRFIRLTGNRPPDTAHVRGTNFCDIGFVVEAATRRIILMSAIDNLGKGAAGQAVQNMNIMLGLDETAGLDMIPFAL
ncbi:MAG: N-acetyl-gamma-glutamyl-phosphate reductase [Desulfobacteraceae bacterium]|jgi:N-acetyl-gamma-glutamyl-phosphate reductase|nr:MAG: N-acetyl-gamma-glutamyl-phosphate reductase [Desulfobacteraceae bacterium]